MIDALRQRLGLVLVAVVVLLLLFANRIAALLTDLWWYEALDYREVFTGILATQVALGAVFGMALAAIVAANLAIARRLRPVILPATAREAILERYRQVLDPYAPWLILGVALLFALSAGGAVAAQWQSYLLWINGGEFGIADPQFGRDVGFFVFDLPWFEFVQGWLFTTLVLTLLLTAVAHYLWGGIRPEAPRDRVSAAAKAHLSVLLALVLAARGWGYWLDRFQLSFSSRGQVTGASYTDVHAELPALTLLLIITGIAIVLVLVNISRRGWLLPGAAIGLLVLASIVLQGIYPAAVQRLRVEPQELVREEPYISRNLEMTRRAYELDEVTSRRFEVANDLRPADVEENEVTLSNIRLWDPEILESTYKELQAIRPYYDFVDVDVDRYEVDGELRQVMIAARELATPQLQEQAKTWQNLHLTYTHGYSVVSSRVNVANPEGQPVFLASDIPAQGADALVPQEQAGIYYGEEHGDYSVVRTGQPEIEFEDETGAQQTTRYEGAGGVPIDGWGRRLAFGLRFGDPNLVLSNLITDESRVVFARLIADRVARVAPFLSLDRDPYAVVVGDRVLWIQDAYTTSAHYPYSERRSFGAQNQAVNYVRNSVKAVVDAYDGTVTLYVVRPDDPVVNAWRRAFPEPFADMEEMPEGLQEHFRYPLDLFTWQANLYETYHIPEAGEFYSKADAWERPEAAAAIANDPNANQGTLLEPYYLLTKLPGEDEEEFVAIQPYEALNKPNMISWMAARSDPEHYGELLSVEFPSGETILGPGLAQARMEQDPTVSAWITLRSESGSQVIRGNQIILPIERSILYVEPLFVKGDQASIPELAQVIVLMGDDVVMEETLEEALATLLETAPPPDADADDEEADDEPVGEADVDALIAEALALFRAADEALAQGDIAGYDRAVDEAREILARIAEQRGVASDTPLPSPSPTATASPS